MHLYRTSTLSNLALLLIRSGAGGFFVARAGHDVSESSRCCTFYETPRQSACSIEIASFRAASIALESSGWNQSHNNIQQQPNRSIDWADAPITSPRTNDTATVIPMETSSNGPTVNEDSASGVDTMEPDPASAALETNDAPPVDRASSNTSVADTTETDASARAASSCSLQELASHHKESFAVEVHLDPASNAVSDSKNAADVSMPLELPSGEESSRGGEQAHVTFNEAAAVCTESSISSSKEKEEAESSLETAATESMAPMLLPKPTRTRATSWEVRCTKSSISGSTQQITNSAHSLAH